MCGISGFAFPEGCSRIVDDVLLSRMRDTLTHRGPDDAGLFRGRNVGLAHRRLSIIDLIAGHQPQSSDDGKLHIVYNGEVYNHLELRRELERSGHRYRTQSDTETVLRLYQIEGLQSVNRLRGMFAFAVWDERKRTLVLARDRFGIKPLYYVHNADGSLYFASEVKALLAVGAISPQLNLSVLPDYLANRAPSGAETLFAGVKRLPAGHTLTWKDGKVTAREYWDLPTDGSTVVVRRREHTIVEEFHHLLRDSVRARLMSDVPLGVFLSGGIDSAAITAIMSELVAEPVKTFSVAFAEREANELEYARSVARAFKTEHHEVVVTPEAFFEALPKLIWHEDEPIAHPSSVALYFVAKLAADHVKVVLTGEGADELLGGYGRYPRTLLNLSLGRMYHRFTTPGLRMGVRRCIGDSTTGGLARRKLRRSFLQLPLDLESIYLDNFAVFSRQLQQLLLSAPTREQLLQHDPYSINAAYFGVPNGTSTLAKLLYADAKTYLHELLMKQDQMSMAASVESRVPYLDHELAEFAARLPDKMKLRGLKTKYILRRSMQNVLPRMILHRSKMGFPVPLGRWFRGRWRAVVEEYVLSDRAAARGLFQSTFVRQLAAEHFSKQADHTERLWCLVNFELWQRCFFDGEPEEEQSRRLLRCGAP